MADEKTIKEKYLRLIPVLTERSKRIWAATEALALGRGGISAVSRATGIHRNTIAQGISEFESPDTLAWDLWLGPAPDRPYHPAYAPASWRGWWDFGTGALGDMGCHIFDPIFYALQLDSPISVEASFSMFVREVMNWDKEFNMESYPQASIVRYRFGARGDLPPVKLTWYDGGLMPERPEELEEGRQMGNAYGGVLFIGDKGKILCNSHGAGGMRIIPETKMQEYERPARKYPRSVGHHREFAEACKGGKPTGSNFDYAGPLSESVLLGNIAILTGKKLLWDSEAMKITNVPKANEYLHREYRKGWSL